MTGLKPERPSRWMPHEFKVGARTPSLLLSLSSLPGMGFHESQITSKVSFIRPSIYSFSRMRLGKDWKRITAVGKPHRHSTGKVVVRPCIKV